MADFTKEAMQQALGAIALMIGRSEKAGQKFLPGTSQYTLQANRIAALNVAAALLQKELESGKSASFAKSDLERARAPIASLLSKSEKAQKKVAEDSWQYAMLARNIEALRIATPLLEQALREIDNQ